MNGTTKKQSGTKNVSLKSIIAAGVLMLGHMVAAAAQVTLAWNPSPDAGVTRYSVYYGPASGNYSQQLSVGNQTSAVVSNLTAGAQYYFVVTASNDLGLESLPSNEISYLVPAVTNPNPAPLISNLAYTPQGAALAWTSVSNRLYRVVYKNTLSDPLWVVASPDLAATGGSLNWVDATAASSSQRFYAVVLLP